MATPESNKPLIDALDAVVIEMRAVQGIYLPEGPDVPKGPPEYGHDERVYVRETARYRDWLFCVVRVAERLEDAIADAKHVAHRRGYYWWKESV